jgi:hypothetical protein
MMGRCYLVAVEPEAETSADYVLLSPRPLSLPEAEALAAKVDPDLLPIVILCPHGLEIPGGDRREAPAPSAN